MAWMLPAMLMWVATGSVPIEDQASEPAPARQAYPVLAERRGKSGVGLLLCMVEADFTLADCKVLAEYPIGLEFGQTALTNVSASTYRLPPADTGKARPGMSVILPVRFSVDGGAPSYISYLPGQATVAVVHREGGKWACRPVFDEPGRCGPVEFRWKVHPPESVTTPIVLAVDKVSHRSDDDRDARSEMNCAVGPEGRLVDCRVSTKVSAAERTAMLDLALQFRAPEQGLDGTPLAGAKIMIGFDWRTLVQAATTLAAWRAEGRPMPDEKGAAQSPAPP